MELYRIHRIIHTREPWSWNIDLRSILLKKHEDGELCHCDLTFILPALNEEDVIFNTLDHIPLQLLRRRGLSYEVIVVDNDSDDRTGEIAEQWGAKVLLEPNRGYGNAYLRGFSEACGDIIVMFDADDTYPVEDTLRLIQPILNGTVDVVIGSRLKGKILSVSASFF